MDYPTAVSEAVTIPPTQIQQTKTKSDFTHAQFEREKTERIKALTQALVAMAGMEKTTSYGPSPAEQVLGALNQVITEQYFVKYL